MTKNFLTAIVPILLCINASTEALHALVDPAPQCTQVIVVHNGVITDWGCLESENECDGIEIDGDPTVCSETDDGGSYPKWTCRCCVNDDFPCAFKDWGLCWVYVHDEPEFNPRVTCEVETMCQTGSCPTPPVQTGAVDCYCQ